MQNARVSCLRHTDERMHINTCVNKSLVQALESCSSNDVTPPAVLRNLVLSLVEIRSQLAKQMHTQTAKKLG